jgi:hypothetical protein
VTGSFSAGLLCDGIFRDGSFEVLPKTEKSAFYVKIRDETSRHHFVYSISSKSLGGGGGEGGRGRDKETDSW